MTTDELKKHGFTLQPDGSYSRVQQNRVVAPRLPDPKPQPTARPALDEIPQGKAEGSRRAVLRIIRKSCRLLDADNLGGSCKPLIDAIRYAGLIADDDPASVELIFAQERVKRRADEGTLVEIIPALTETR
jgi:hypothetical protein